MNNHFRVYGLGAVLTFWAILFLNPQVSLSQSEDELAPVSGTYAIDNITIIPAPGRTIEKGVIIIKDGVIHNLGQGIAIPPEATIIKGDSMFAYAGFIDGFSHLSVITPKQDNKEKIKYPGNPPPERAGITPERDVRDYINPKDKSISDFRSQGFTVAQVVPNGNLLPGHAAIVLLAGNSVSEMVLVDKSSMYSELSGASNVYPATIMGVMAKWRELYKQASLAKSYDATYASNPVGLERPESSRILKSFYPVIDGKSQVLFNSTGVIETQRVLSLKNDLGFRLMIGDLKEGWPIVNKLKDSKAPLFLSLDLPELAKELKEDSTASAEKKALNKRRNESIANYTSQAAVLSKAGIQFGFSTNSVKAKSIHGNLRRMIEAGLSEDVALASLTTTPAQLLGLSNRLGTLEKGKIANVVLTNKPYFHEKSKVKYVFVDGKLFKTEEAKNETTGKKIVVEGEWSYTADTPQGKGTGNLTIKNNSNDYEGTITNNFSGQETTINEFSLGGNNMSFNYNIDIGGNQIKIAVSVAVNGDTFEGSMTAGQFGNFPMKGTRQPQTLMLSDNK